MNKVFSKALKFVKADNKKVRLISFINKSPIRFATKSILNLTHSSLVTERLKMFEQLQLSQQEQEIVKQLQEKGYAQVTHIINTQLLQEMLAHSFDRHSASSQLTQEQTQTNKDFWVRLTDQEFKNGLNTENIFVKFGLQESVLRVVAGYLKKAAFLEYVLLTLSKGKNEPLKSSQLWHLDYDNVGMLKMFVYLTDVSDLDHGPFTFIDRIQSAKIDTSTFNTHIEDADLFKVIDPKDVVQMIAPKLSVFMVDTSRCYHMGSRLKEGYERLMYTALYLDLPSIYPWSGFQKIKNVTPNLSPLQKMGIEA